MRQIQMLHGKGISELSAAGPLRFYDRPPLAPVIHSSRTPQEEWKRFLAARHNAILELAALCDVVISRLGQDLANIFFAHAVLMEDDDLTAMVKQDIFTGMTAEYAVYRVCDHFVMEFQALHDPYMQARAMDILDVSRRLFRALEGWREPDPLFRGPAILVVPQILPSEVLALDPQKLLGIIACQGSLDSHSTMILRSMEVAAIAQVEVPRDWNDRPVLLDGATGRIYLEPDPNLVQQPVVRTPRRAPRQLQMR